MIRDSEARLRRTVEDMCRREQDLIRRVTDLEMELARNKYGTYRPAITPSGSGPVPISTPTNTFPPPVDPHLSKKIRLSEIVDTPTEIAQAK